MKIGVKLGHAFAETVQNTGLSQPELWGVDDMLARYGKQGSDLKPAPELGGKQFFSLDIGRQEAAGMISELASCKPAVESVFKLEHDKKSLLVLLKGEFQAVAQAGDFTSVPGLRMVKAVLDEHGASLKAPSEQQDFGRMFVVVAKDERSVRPLMDALWACDALHDIIDMRHQSVEQVQRQVKMLQGSTQGIQPSRA